jgi:hypothetical protein
MAVKLTSLTHKIAMQLHLVQRTIPFAVLVPGGQSGKFWIHPRMSAPAKTARRILGLRLEETASMYRG